MKQMGFAFALAAASLAVVAAPSLAITAGQVDDFQDSTTQSWGGGDQLTTPTGGPLGAGDIFLHLESFGGGSTGSKLATTNSFQWSGDYTAAGVTQLGVDILNPNTSPVATPLNIRLVLFGTLGSRWSSTVGTLIPADNQWHHAVFSLASADMTLVLGSQTFPQVISNVVTLQIRYDQGAAPSSGGTTFAGTMGLDNITAISGPATLRWNNTGGSGDGLTWDVATNQNWRVAGAPAVFRNGDFVIFDDSNNGNYNVALNTAVTAGSMSVSNSAGAYVISGSGGVGGTGGLTKTGTALLTLSTANTFTGATGIDAGTLTLSSAGSLASTSITIAAGATANFNGSLAAAAVVNANGSTSFGGNTGITLLNRPLAALNIGSGVTSVVAASTFPFTPVALKPSALTFASGTAKLNLTNNEVVTAATLASLVARIVSGQIFTSSTGGGLGSLDLGSGQAEVRFTLLGDTNLDGNVDVTDLGNLASSYGATSGATWVQGDTNYSGGVDVTDLGNLASNYGGSLAAGPSVLITSSEQTSAATAVPEPAMAACLALFAPAFLCLRRRARRRN